MNPPTPARVAWQSESMPPSPVTTVNVRNKIARATPWLTTPIQKSFNQIGTEKSATAAASGPTAARHPLRRGGADASGSKDPDRRSISKRSRRSP